SRILGKRDIENFFLISFVDIGSGNPTQHIRREVDVGVEIKIISPSIGRDLRIEIEIINWSDDKLSLNTSCQSKICIELFLKFGSDVRRVYEVDRDNTQFMFFACIFLPDISHTCLP